MVVQLNKNDLSNHILKGVSGISDHVNIINSWLDVRPLLFNLDGKENNAILGLSFKTSKNPYSF